MACVPSSQELSAEKSRGHTRVSDDGSGMKIHLGKRYAQPVDPSSVHFEKSISFRQPEQVWGL
jgi:hypothetical protein